MTNTRTQRIYACLVEQGQQTSEQIAANLGEPYKGIASTCSHMLQRRMLVVALKLAQSRGGRHIHIWDIGPVAPVRAAKMYLPVSLPTLDAPRLEAPAPSCLVETPREPQCWRPVIVNGQRADVWDSYQ